MHPRNKYQGNYDFKNLISDYPPLSNYIIQNPRGDDSITFSDSASVKALNKALLKSYYNIEYWDLPEGYLVPPIPSRSDYIHHVADLLDQNKSATQVTMLDIGTGANLIYPIVGISAYGWTVVGCDTDQQALNNAQTILDQNPQLGRACTLRHQPNKKHILKGVINSDDRFDIVVCNPPFHTSALKAQKASGRKRKNLKYKESSSTLNFGGQSHELWYPGGELAFLKIYIRQSKTYRSQCGWFTALISSHRILDSLQNLLKEVNAKETKVIDMKHGQKVSRILGWKF